MANGNRTFDWRAVAGFVALLVGIFTLTNFLTTDKIDSKIQSHSIQTEATHQRDLIVIKEDIASLKKGQSNLEKTTERLEAQNREIIRKLDEMARR
jgi:FtsZ-binding cell division protein ZapB